MKQWHRIENWYDWAEWTPAGRYRYELTWFYDAVHLAAAYHLVSYYYDFGDDTYNSNIDCPRNWSLAYGFQN